MFTCMRAEDPGQLTTLQHWLCGVGQGSSARQKSPRQATSGAHPAGHYVPNLALAVSDYNLAKNGPRINFQGFLAGNAWTGQPLMLALLAALTQCNASHFSTITSL